MNIDVMLPQQRRVAAQLARRFMTARDKFDVFVESVVADDHGNLLQLAPLHRQWFAHVEYCWARGLKAMVLAHFGSGKSSTLAVPIIAWLIGRDPNLRVKVVTNDDGAATKRVGRIKQIVESGTYAKVFPEVRPGPKWTDHEITVTRTGSAIDPTVQARGVMTTGIGGRADLMIFDDVVDQRNSMDLAQRKKVLELLEQTWLSRLEPDAHVLYIGTPWHQSDATHALMVRAGWCALVQRVSDDCTAIEQEVVGVQGMADYPIVGAQADKNAAVP